MFERFRAFWGGVFRPIARLLLSWGVSPDAVTLVGTLGVCAGALIFFPQGLLLAGVLVITAFVFSDIVDGNMARMSGRVSPFGAFLDSTLDRIADAAVFGGLAMYYAGPGDNRWLVALALYNLVTGSVTRAYPSRPPRGASGRTRARRCGERVKIGGGGVGSASRCRICPDSGCSLQA